MLKNKKKVLVRKRTQKLPVHPIKSRLKNIQIEFDSQNNPKIAVITRDFYTDYPYMTKTGILKFNEPDRIPEFVRVEVLRLAKQEWFKKILQAQKPNP